MGLFGNRGLNLLVMHHMLHRFAWGGSGIFIGIYLYREGVPLPQVFLAYTAILALRFLFRLLLPQTVAWLGLRDCLIIATALQAVQYPMLALVHGPDPALALFCAVAGLGGALYFTSYHTYFSALGDIASRGAQIGLRQILSAMAAILGPAFGGVMLAAFGPWAAFGAAGAIEMVAILPLFGIAEIQSGPIASLPSFAAARTGLLLFVTDGWISNTAVLTWNLILFRSLNARFDALGGTLAAASLAGALGGAVLGRFIDLGHARPATWINAAAAGLSLLIRSLCGDDPGVVVPVAILAALIGGLYIPALFTAFYNQAKASISPLGYQILAEGAWDVGGLAVTVIAAAALALGMPLQFAILLALPAVPIQARVLESSYSMQKSQA